MLAGLSCCMVIRLRMVSSMRLLLYRYRGWMRLIMTRRISHAQRHGNRVIIPWACADDMRQWFNLISVRFISAVAWTYGILRLGRTVVHRSAVVQACYTACTEYSSRVKGVWQILWLTIRKSCVLAPYQFLHKWRSKTSREKDGHSKIRASMSHILVVVRFSTNYLLAILTSSRKKFVDGIRTDRTVPAETPEMNQQFRDARLLGGLLLRHTWGAPDGQWRAKNRPNMHVDCR